MAKYNPDAVGEVLYQLLGFFINLAWLGFGLSATIMLAMLISGLSVPIDMQVINFTISAALSALVAYRLIKLRDSLLKK